MKTEYKWVVARYTGEQAKEVKGLAEAGLGYFQIQSGVEKRQNFVVVAFPFVPDNNGIPEHLTELSDSKKILKLEKDRCVRSEIHRPLEDEDTKIAYCRSCGQK